jgi:hypothetical protein
MLVIHQLVQYLDGVVLVSGAGGTVFESLARPNIFMTDPERVNVIGDCREDRTSVICLQPCALFFNLYIVPVHYSNQA